MIESHFKKLQLLCIIILGIIQSYYLFNQFSRFIWVGFDDLLTLTLISKESYQDFLSALKSGINLFPPLYFFLAFVLIEVFTFSKDILIWIHIPLLWVSLYLSYKLFRSFTNWQIASLATIAISTIKSAFLTQIVYVRPYCLYYCATLFTSLCVIKFIKTPNKINFIIYWVSFQILTNTHYYGFIFGLLVSIPLIFIKIGFKNRIICVFITIIPTIISYYYFLSNQLNYNIFHGTLGKTDVFNIFSYYIVLCPPALVIFLITFCVSLFMKKRKSNPNIIPYSLFMIGSSPFLIILLLHITFGEGTHYRYFIPSQIGIISFVIYLHQRKFYFNYTKFVNFIFLITSFILVAVWCIRNLGSGETNTQNTFPDAMDFNHSLLLENNIPIFTSHIPTFLKTIYDTKWHKKPNLLRTDQRDFVELPKFSKILKPSSIDSLIYNDAFYYHYYYSGSHSNIVFDPWQWANENDYSISIINQYPQVTLLKKNN